MAIVKCAHCDEDISYPFLRLTLDYTYAGPAKEKPKPTETALLCGGCTAELDKHFLHFAALDARV
jgi:hypothetical protein